MLTIETSNGCYYERGDGYQVVVLPMKATGKARPRVTTKGAYMPREYQEARDALRMLFGTVYVKPPCEMRLVIVRKFLAKMKAAERRERLWTSCDAKPDNDNIEGWVMDTLFEEDSGVSVTSSVKVWGPRDIICIELRKIDPAARLIDGDVLLEKLGLL